MKILEVKNFSFRYKNISRNVLEDVTFTASEGELILVCGATACGKTTLLRSLKPELSLYGEKNGEIAFCGEPYEKLDERTSAAQIGYVTQRPENQVVTDTVRSELCFGGESLGLEQNIIRRQAAESAAYFGLEKLLDQRTSELSGGQRQLLNLASVMAVNPKLLILDEPTAQLDPIAAGDFIRTLYRITRELAVTVIIAEHRFEELLPVADKVLLLENGRVSVFDTPQNAAEKLSQSSGIRPSLPAGLQVCSSFSLPQPHRFPLTLGKSREAISSCFDKKITSLTPEKRQLSDDAAIELKNVFFTYGGADVITNASLTIQKGEVFSLLGSNGSGKSTLMSLISGVEKPYRGKVYVNGKNLRKYRSHELYPEVISMLGQDVQSSFLHDSVGEELSFIESTDIYDFTSLYDMHPYDLSGGQQQLLAIKKLLKNDPEIVVMDEPTKGLDGSWRDVIAGIILSLREQGKTVMLVTHDTELAAMVSDRCGIFFDGRVSAVGTPQELFTGSLFYTTGAVRISKGIYDGITTTSQLMRICTENGVREGIIDEQQE